MSATKFTLSPPKSKHDSGSVEGLIRTMLKKYRTPLMLIVRSILEKQYLRFRKALPDVIPYYAIKANPHPDILKVFMKLGSSFDVASAGEMRQVLGLGVAPSKIIFANTIKSPEDIEFARKRHVRLVTFDNEPELYKLAKHSPGAHVLVRVKVDNRGSVVELSLKFGADAEQAVYLLRKAKTLGLVPTGLSFHVGSQSTNVENYLQALEMSAGIFKEARQAGLNLKIVDIGGGFPIQHFDDLKI